MHTATLSAILEMFDIRTPRQKAPAEKISEENLNFKMKIAFILQYVKSQRN